MKNDIRLFLLSFDVTKYIESPRIAPNTIEDTYTPINPNELYIK